MRIVLQLGLCCLLAGGAWAQRGGGHGGGMGGGAVCAAVWAAAVCAAAVSGGGAVRGGGGILRRRFQSRRILRRWIPRRLRRLSAAIGGYGGYHGYRGLTATAIGYGYGAVYGASVWDTYGGLLGYPYYGYPYVGGYWPGYSDYYPYDYGYSYYARRQPPIVYAPAAAAAAPVVVERATPVTREYDQFGQEMRPAGAAPARRRFTCSPSGTT